MITIADWIVAAGTVVMAIVAIVAIFQDKIRVWLTHPKLEGAIATTSPDCIKITLLAKTLQQEKVPVDTYYLRIRIKNEGNEKAENVEVFAAELSKRQADGVTFKRVDDFEPMNLVWTNFGGTIFFPAISPRMYKFCDIAHIMNPAQRANNIYAEDKHWPGIPLEKTILSFDTFVKPHTLSYLHPFGTYRLVIVVAATNAKPGTITLEIALTGDWYDDASRMLGEGVTIRVVK
ncbi:MAG: hypothetical protein HC875_20140 [Anaerolineales bacterium]|nr:hypothetical protein [Anaerolineales bacterium]